MPVKKTKKEALLENAELEQAEQGLQEEAQGELEQDNLATLIPPKEDFYAELKKLLNDNAKWVEQVKMSLLVVSHLYDSFCKIEKGYETSLRECREISAEVKEKYEQIKALKEAIEEHYKELQEKAADFEERIEAQAEKVEGIREDCEYLKHEVDVYYTEIENFRVKLEFFKEDFTKKESELNERLENFNNEFSQKKTALEKLISDASDDLNALRTQANLDKTSLKSLVAELKVEIEQTKESAKGELEALKSDALDEMREKAEEQKTNLENFAEKNLGTLYAHIFGLERVLMEKGVINLGDIEPLPLEREEA